MSQYANHGSVCHWMHSTNVSLPTFRSRVVPPHLANIVSLQHDYMFVSRLVIMQLLPRLTVISRSIEQEDKTDFDPDHGTSLFIPSREPVSRESSSFQPKTLFVLCHLGASSWADRVVSIASPALGFLAFGIGMFRLILVVGTILDQSSCVQRLQYGGTYW